RADRADEAERGAAFDACSLDRERPAGVALALRFTKIFLAEDRWNHPVGRSVADAGGDKEYKEHREEAGEVPGTHEIEDTNGGRRHRDEIPERDDRAADLVGEQAAERTRERTNQRSQERNADGDRGKLRLDQKRKGRRVTDEGTEGPDI